MVPISSMRGDKQIGHLTLSEAWLPKKNGKSLEGIGSRSGSSSPQPMEEQQGSRQQVGVESIGATLTRLSAGSPRESRLRRGGTQRQQTSKSMVAGTSCEKGLPSWVSRMLPHSPVDVGF
jgi:hypothetical protein